MINHEKIFLKHRKKFLCGFFCLVLCSIFSFNCFATSFTYRSYSDLTTTNSTYQALADMAKFATQNNNTVTLSFRSETETHFLVLSNQVFDYIDWHDNYFIIPGYTVINDFYYLNSVPVGYGNNTRYFVRYNGVDWDDDDTFKIYINHSVVSNSDWGLETATSLDINSDMVNFTYMFLTIAILLFFMIILRLR